MEWSKSREEVKAEDWQTQNKTQQDNIGYVIQVANRTTKGHQKFRN
jgi:hypothetical protein